MEKRLYGKPLMSMEQFTPSEYVSVCWYIKEGDCFDNLYHDTKTTRINYVFWESNVYGYYNDGEAMCTNHGSHRVPAETATPKWFKADALPQSNITNDDKYYTGYSPVNTLINGTLLEYNGRVSGNFYSCIDGGGTTHYFKEPTEAGNHS